MHETIFSAFALSHRFYDGMQPAYNQKTRAALYSITTLRAALHLNSTKITESEVLAALQNTHTDAHPASVSCRHALRRVDPLRCAHLQATGPGQLAPTCSLPADRVSGSTVPTSFSAKSSTAGPLRQSIYKKGDPADTAIIGRWRWVLLPLDCMQL